MSSPATDFSLTQLALHLLSVDRSAVEKSRLVVERSTYRFLDLFESYERSAGPPAWIWRHLWLGSTHTTLPLDTA